MERPGLRSSAATLPPPPASPAPRRPPAAGRGRLTLAVAGLLVASLACSGAGDRPATGDAATAADASSGESSVATSPAAPEATVARAAMPVVDPPCTAPASWFPHDHTPEPNDEADFTSNCDFHQWSVQTFLWLTQASGSPRRCPTAASASRPSRGRPRCSPTVTLQNCLGGRFSPGIDMTFIVRQPGLWRADWPTQGPFRIAAQDLDCSQATEDRPFLTAGWFPLRSAEAGCAPFSPGIEPGDTSKFMALPWHTDYNSCATHTPAPNPPDSLTLYWSWPAQRPVAVYAAADVRDGRLGAQVYSVRGPGTQTDDASEVGRYQNRLDMVKNWTEIGVVMQGTRIESGSYPDDFYLEVESRLGDGGNRVVPWPNTVRDQPPVIPGSGDDATSDDTA